MKKNIKKVITILCIVVISLCIIGCNNAVEKTEEIDVNEFENKSNIEILKDFSLMDENVYEESIYVDDDLLYGKDEPFKEITRRWVHKKTDNRVQYIMEKEMNIYPDNNKMLYSYAIEFREDGIYATPIGTVYENTDEVPDLISGTSSSDFAILKLKLPLKEENSWEDLNYGSISIIQKVEEDIIEVYDYSKNRKGKEGNREIYRKGVGPSDLTFYDESGKISREFKSTIKRKR